jgi:hypothetical protein
VKAELVSNTNANIAASASLGPPLPGAGVLHGRRTVAKRWLADDFAVPAGLTAHRRHIRVTLTPAPGATATAFRIEVLSRCVH